MWLTFADSNGWGQVISNCSWILHDKSLYYGLTKLLNLDLKVGPFSVKAKRAC